MKEQILKLRAEGKSYKEISNIINCSISNVCYHCGRGQKEKSAIRQIKNKSALHPMIKKIQTFKARRALKTKVQSFQHRMGFNHPLKTPGERKIPSKEVIISFNLNDVINKFGNNPYCRLTGRKIDWEDSSTYTLDHIIPVSLGGENSLENLNIVCPQANKSKSNLLTEDFLQLCREVLEFHGFYITKINNGA